MIALLLAVTLEIRISDYMWKSPQTLHGILGNVQRRSDDCPDATGARQIEYERGYVCVRKDRIVILNYDFAHDVNSPEEALATVGLKMTQAPDRYMSNTVFIWSVAHNNALRIGTVPATRVIAVISGGTRGVTVDVGGD